MSNEKKPETKNEIEKKTEAPKAITSFDEEGGFDPAQVSGLDQDLASKPLGAYLIVEKMGVNRISMKQSTH